MGPFHISTKGEYALLALFDLATQRPGEPVKIASIARRQKIPQKFLELILAALKQGGFVESRRGAEGGYLLARGADTISVGEVLRHTDGNRGKGHRKRGETPYSDLWREVDQAVSGVLDTMTLQQIARRWRERQSRYVPNWDI